MLPHSAATIALKRLMGLTGTVNQLKNQCALYFLLIVLCVTRSQLTITAAKLYIIPYSILPDVVQNHIRVKLNDIVTVAIYILVPLLCGRSIASQHEFLKLTSSRGFSFNAFFTDELKLMKPIPVVIFLLTSGSGGYMLRLVCFIYDEWTNEFIPLVQTLQLLPALLIICQTLYQGYFLLLAFGNRDFLRTIVRPDHDTCLKQFWDHVLLNITLILHCASILAIVGFKYVDQHDLIIDLAVGEIMYRLFTVGALLYLIVKVEARSRKSIETSSKESSIASEDAQCSLKPSVEESTTEWDKSTSELVTTWSPKIVFVDV